MSRARPIEINGETVWFDRKGDQATDEQLELLASLHEIGEGLDEDTELDDLLDADLSQGQVLALLRKALGQGMPPEVADRKERWREQRAIAPACRICGKRGDSTKHHFVNKWILKELEKYPSVWSDRRINTIPLCIHCHRSVHTRGEGPHSIADYLTDEEMGFAHRALETFVDERPAVAWLVIRGDESVYETRLMRDWIEGKFEVHDIAPASPPSKDDLRSARNGDG